MSVLTYKKYVTLKVVSVVINGKWATTPKKHWMYSRIRF